MRTRHYFVSLIAFFLGALTILLVENYLLRSGTDPFNRSATPVAQPAAVATPLPTPMPTPTMTELTASQDTALSQIESASTAAEAVEAAEASIDATLDAMDALDAQLADEPVGDETW